jgi:hypothetical protein
MDGRTPVGLSTASVLLVLSSKQRGLIRWSLTPDTGLTNSLQNTDNERSATIDIPAPHPLKTSIPFNFPDFSPCQVDLVPARFTCCRACFTSDMQGLARLPR